MLRTFLKIYILCNLVKFSFSKPISISSKNITSIKLNERTDHFIINDLFWMMVSEQVFFNFVRFGSLFLATKYKVFRQCFPQNTSTFKLYAVICFIIATILNKLPAISSLKRTDFKVLFDILQGSIFLITYKKYTFINVDLNIEFYPAPC